MRLAREGYPAVRTNQKSAPFDPALEEAVREFQRRHGLEVDAIVGARRSRP